MAIYWGIKASLFFSVVLFTWEGGKLLVMDGREKEDSIPTSWFSESCLQGGEGREPHRAPMDSCSGLCSQGLSWVEAGLKAVSCGWRWKTPGHLQLRRGWDATWEPKAPKPWPIEGFRHISDTSKGWGCPMRGHKRGRNKGLLGEHAKREDPV